MKEVCSHCHTPDYVNGFYQQYDDLVILYNEKFAKPGLAIINALKQQGLLTKPDFDEEIEWTWFYLWHHEGRRARHGASMMAPDYTHWHGMYEVAERFYMELMPEAQELVANARRSGQGAPAQAVEAVIDESPRPAGARLVPGDRRRAGRDDPQGDGRALRQGAIGRFGLLRSGRQSMDRRTFFKLAGSTGIVAFSCSDQDEAARLPGEGLHLSGRPHLEEGAVPLLRHRLRRRSRRPRRSRRSGARRRGEPGQPRPALRQGLPPAGLSLRRGPADPPAAPAARRLLPADLLGRGARPDREQVPGGAGDHGPGVGRHVRLGTVDRLRRLRRAQVGAAPACGSNNLEPNARLCMASGGDGLHDAVPERRADGLLRGLRGRRRLRPLGQQHGRDAPGAVQPHPRDQAAEARACASSTSAPGARRPPTTPTCTSSSGPAPTSRSPTASSTCWSRTARSIAAFVAENVVFKRGIEDLEKIGYGCYGEQAEHYTFKDEARDSSFDDLVAFLADYTPERVSAISGVPVAQIEALAELYGDPNRGTVSSGAWASTSTRAAPG